MTTTHNRVPGKRSELPHDANKAYLIHLIRGLKVDGVLVKKRSDRLVRSELALRRKYLDQDGHNAVKVVLQDERPHLFQTLYLTSAKAVKPSPKGARINPIAGVW